MSVDSDDFLLRPGTSRMNLGHAVPLETVERSNPLGEVALDGVGDQQVRRQDVHAHASELAIADARSDLLRIDDVDRAEGETGLEDAVVLVAVATRTLRRNPHHRVAVETEDPGLGERLRREQMQRLLAG